MHVAVRLSLGLLLALDGAGCKPSLTTIVEARSPESVHVQQVERLGPETDVHLDRRKSGALWIVSNAEVGAQAREVVDAEGRITLHELPVLIGERRLVDIGPDLRATFPYYNRFGGSKNGGHLVADVSLSVPLEDVVRVRERREAPGPDWAYWFTMGVGSAFTAAGGYGTGVGLELGTVQRAPLLGFGIPCLLVGLALMGSGGYWLLKSPTDKVVYGRADEWSVGQ